MNIQFNIIFVFSPYKEHAYDEHIEMSKQIDQPESPALNIVNIAQNRIVINLL